MNELGYFQTFWLFIWGYIKQSFVYKLLRGIYDAISGAWHKSAITGFFRREHFSAETASCSVSGRILRLPFTFLEWLAGRIGRGLSNVIKTSCVVRVCNIYLQNLLALNTRFCGFLAVGAAVGMLAASRLSGAAPGLICYIMFVLGVVLCFFDLNLTGYLSGSWLMRAAEHLLGLDMSYDIYDESCTAGASRLWIAVIAGIAAGALGGFMGLAYTALTVGGLFIVFLILKSARAGVYLSVFLAPLMPTMAMVALALLSIFSLIIEGLTEDGFKWRFEGLGFLILGYLLIYIFSAVNSFAVANSLSIVAVYTVFLLFYFAVINTIRTKKQLFQALSLFAISGALVCLYGIAQYVFGWDASAAWVDEEMFTDIKMRVYSTLENPNVLGEYILLVLPVCVGLLWQKRKKLSKFVYLAAAVLMFATLILTFSRGCWIGIMISAGIFVTLVCGKLWGLALIVLPFIPMFLPESIINRFMSVGDMKDSSTSYRVYIWFGTFAMLKDFWASGIGPGSQAFQAVYPFYSYSGVVAPHSHNMFLQIFVETGIVGIAVFVGILFMFFKKLAVGFQPAKSRKDGLSVMIAAIASGVLGFAVQGMFDNCFYNYRVYMIFWFVLALGIAAVYAAKDERKAVNRG